MTQAVHANFDATLTLVDAPMFNFHIVIPSQVAEIFRQGKGAVRVLCSINNHSEFPCALNPRGSDYIVIASKALIKKHRLQLDVPFKMSLRLDPNDGLLMPEELVEVLDQDEWGSQLFESLLPGQKRSYLYYIRTAKSVDTRIKRAIEIVEKLKVRKTN